MMVRLVLRFFAVIGVVTVLGLGIGGGLLWRSFMAKPDLPDAIVVTLDLDHHLDTVNEGGLSGGLLGNKFTVQDAINTLDRARRDPRVKAVVARVGDAGLGLAQHQELRAALARVRAAGKHTLAFAETFGEFGPGNKPYYLASAFEQVWLQPVGLVGLTGLNAELPSARRLLDRIGIVPEIGRRAEFKSAMEMLTEATPTAPHRAMMESLIGDLSDQMLGGIAESRHLTPDAVRVLTDRGPLLGREAQAAGLVDRIGYYDEALDQSLEQAGSEAEAVDAAEYLAGAGEPHKEGKVIALIQAQGTIVRGEKGSPLNRGQTITSVDLVEAFRQASEDDDVRAILFRVDSPGGSAVASESIRRAVVQAREAGKPVVVSMGDAAASGGYWISMNANRIIAAPGTLTGSIGVIAGKVATGGLWEWLGVGWQSISRNHNAGMWSFLTPYSDSERARLNAVLDDIYGAFTSNVAEARHLSPEKVQEIARGRVWTGRQALPLGLVDEVGDMALALTRAREAAGLAPNAAVKLAPFPRPDSFLERLADLLSGSGLGMSASVRSWMALVSRLSATLEPGQAQMAPFLLDGSLP